MASMSQALAFSAKNSNIFDTVSHVMRLFRGLFFFSFSLFDIGKRATGAHAVVGAY